MQTKMNSTSKLNQTYSRIMNNSYSRSPQSHKRPQSQTQNLIIPQSHLIRQTTLHKNMKLSIMLRNVHTFTTSIDELDWIFLQTEKIMANYIKITTQEDSSYHAHKIQVQNIYRELVMLISRWKEINKQELTQHLNFQHQDRIPCENTNTLNLKKTETTRSFKMVQTENEEQFPEFSKIKLPQTKERLPTQLTYEHDEKIKQYESAIQILKEDIELQKKQKEKMKSNFQRRVQEMEEKVEQWKMNWKSYEVFAKGTIRKCKEYLHNFGVDKADEQRDDIENYLDELFKWENKINQGLTNNELELNLAKEQRIQELADIEFRIRQKKNQLRKAQNSSRTTYRTQEEHFSISNSLTNMLYAQAATIQRLI